MENLDLNTLRSAVTVAGLLLFLGLVARVYGRAQRAAHDEAAQLPFADEPGLRGHEGERRE